jgi:hypothetical protein
MADKLVGVLGVEIHHANDLEDGFDPYCKLYLGDTVQETNVDEGGEDAPEWKETFEFNVDNVPAEFFRIEVWDKDMILDKLLGTAQVALEALLATKGELAQYDLFNTGGKAGDIAVSSTFQDGGQAVLKQQLEEQSEEEEEEKEVKTKMEEIPEPTWAFKSMDERQGLQAMVSDEIILDIAHWFDCVDINHDGVLSKEELDSYFYNDSGWYSPDTILFSAEDSQLGVSHDDFINFVLGLWARNIAGLTSKRIRKYRKRFENPFGVRPNYVPKPMGKVTFDSWEQGPQNEGKSFGSYHDSAPDSARGDSKFFDEVSEANVMEGRSFDVVDPEAIDDMREERHTDHVKSHRRNRQH